MKDKQAILDLWRDAVMYGVGITFSNTYGQSTGRQRYFETVDAFSRDDAYRIVKSVAQLWNDIPQAGTANWPAMLQLYSLRKHTMDDDYLPKQRVPSSTRDPNINMHSEAVTEANALLDVEPCDDAYNYAKLKDTLS